MATASSLRAELSGAVVNALIVGAASTVLAAGILAAAFGPLGLVALVVAPVDLGVALLLNRNRAALRERARRLAGAGGRGVAVVLESEPTDRPARGGQTQRHLKVEVRPAAGLPFTAEADVHWTAAVPGTWGVAAWDPAQPGDLLAYFASGPRTPAAMEAAMNRETGQHGREPVLGDDPPA